MLCFSSHSRNSGTGFGHGHGFTPSQWMELEHQALIFKYLSANVPIPSYLLNPIRRAFHSLPFASLRSTSSSSLGGWGGTFHMGFSTTDPEPGRCRRTDGKKWRCSRDAVADQKYCERHMNRGRHRSRKPVEPSSTAGATTTTTTAAAAASTTGASTVIRNKEIADGAYRHTTTVLSMMSPKSDVKTSHNGYYDDSARPEFGRVCSDSLLNPLIKSSSLVNYRTYNDNNKPTTQLSISIPTTSSSDNHHSHELEMGLGLGSQHTRQATNWAPISWEPSIGGPLGEVLHTTPTDCKPLNLINGWDNHGYNHSLGSQIGPSSSPTGVLQRGAFGSLSNSSAGSSPRAESNKNPYLPAI